MKSSLITIKFHYITIKTHNITIKTINHGTTSRTPPCCARRAFGAGFALGGGGLGNELREVRPGQAAMAWTTDISIYSSCIYIGPIG